MDGISLLREVSQLMTTCVTFGSKTTSFAKATQQSYLSCDAFKLF